MIKAMNAVMLNEMGVNEAATQHNVPPTTLKNRLSGRMTHRTKPGPQGYLTAENEELAGFLIECCKIGMERQTEKLYSL